jgi:hypothetical protein
MTRDDFSVRRRSLLAGSAVSLGSSVLVGTNTRPTRATTQATGTEPETADGTIETAGTTRRAVLGAGVSLAGAMALFGHPSAARTADVGDPGRMQATGANTTSEPPTGAWFAGDGHVHTDHSSDGSFTRQGTEDAGPGTTGVGDQVGFAADRGLDWLPLTDHRTFDQHWDPQWTSDEVLLLTGEEANDEPHCTVLGATDTAVQGAEPEGAPGFRNLQQSVWDVRAQGALWNQAHPDRDIYDAETGRPTDTNYASQVGQALVEVWNRALNPEAEIDYAENRWRNGWRFGVAGASDNHDKALWGIDGPGSPTTWVFAPEGSKRGILTGLGAARTVVSSAPEGPFPTIEADINGDGVFEGIVGSELLAEPGQEFTLRVTAKRATGNEVLVYGAPGRTDAAGNPVDPVARFRAAQPVETRSLTVTAPEQGHGWWYVMIRGPGSPSGLGAPKDPDDQLRAMTTPVFVSVTGEPAAPEPEVPVPSDAGEPDGAKRVFGGTDRFAGFSDVAVGDEAVHVVAERHAPTATRVVYRRWTADGVRSETVVISGETDSARFPRVAAQGETVWAVWQDERNGQTPSRPTIYLRESTDGGRTWGAPQTLSCRDGRAMHPAIAATPDGEPVVAWQDDADSIVFDIKALVVGRDDAPINLSAADKDPMPATPEDTRSAVLPTSLYPAVAIREDGLIAVSWHDNRLDRDPLWTGQMADPLTFDATDCEPPEGIDYPACVDGEGTNPDNWEIMVATRASGAEWGEFLNASGAEGRADWHSTLGFARNGDLIVAWDAKDNSSSSGRDLFVRAARSTDDGASFRPAVAVTDVENPGMARRPTFGRDANGSLVLTWSDSRSEDWRWRVFAAPVTATGFGEQTPLTGPGNATFQRLDNGVLVFTSDRDVERVQRSNGFGVFSMGSPGSRLRPEPGD